MAIAMLDYQIISSVGTHWEHHSRQAQLQSGDNRAIHIARSLTHHVELLLYTIVIIFKEWILLPGAVLPEVVPTSSKLAVSAHIYNTKCSCKGCWTTISQGQLERCRQLTIGF